MKFSSFAPVFALFAVAQAAVLPKGLLAESASEPGILSQRDDSPNIYEKNVAKGRGYWDQLQTNLQNADATDVAAIDFNAKWEARSPSIGSASEAAQFAMQKAGLNTRQQFLSVTASLKTNRYIYYTDAMSPSIGTIIAKNNYGRAVDPHTGVVTNAPDKWSAVTWHLWQQACKQANNKDPSGLDYVFQDHIINEQTIKALDDAMAVAESKKTDNQGEPVVTTWTPDDDQFYAALATPNAVGVAYLLKDYPVGLGWKTIESISVFWLHGFKEPNMWFKLKPFCG
ncbi:hypothetical protein N7474_001277 [Penicillium riverlandense]|uniref:uncharacterized protein n=1 Tax=Penicillium riverlandense TaxID=1903569 RepID=UPI00254926EC|nr:uncharacterized protein N7474_001277 [Penicillium riverlandense]KAJ5832966.1 hypothetical protein N7474_001277 [Penicillium riverlandense]